MAKEEDQNLWASADEDEIEHENLWC